MKGYLKVEISAETKQQADGILNNLLAQKLVTGGQIIESPARFLWKNEVVDMDYMTVTSFTTEQHKQAIIQEVKKISVEEVPMIVFLPMDGNAELLAWIQETLA
jgi:uncharacterized protein involved in tolerance to divalent cations